MAHKYAEIAFTSTVKKCRRKWEVALVTHPLSPGQTATTSSEIVSGCSSRLGTAFTLPVSVKPVSPTSSIGVDQPDF